MAHTRLHSFTWETATLTSIGCDWRIFWIKFKFPSNETTQRTFLQVLSDNLFISGKLIAPVPIYHIISDMIPPRSCVLCVHKKLERTTLHMFSRTQVMKSCCTRGRPSWPDPGLQPTYFIYPGGIEISALRNSNRFGRNWQNVFSYTD